MASCWMRLGSRNLFEQEEGRNALSVLKTFHDRCSGLWGLRRRKRMTVMPRYKEVFDTCADRAAVCLEDGRTGVVDDNGKPKIIIDRCRKLRFLKGDLLAVTGNDADNGCLHRPETVQDLSGEAGGVSFGCMELPYAVWNC